MATVYLGIGSNVGERERNCERALALLRKKGLAITRTSSMIETEPWGVEDQPRFINMAAEARTELGPQALLSLLKEVEAEMGRVPSGRWGPRVMDLDILFYDDLVLEEPGLVIPHPRLHERDFVLRPLREIAPGLIHPVLKKRIREL